MKVLGLDIGTKSVGWALVEDGASRNERKIIDCGVRMFEAVGKKRKERGEKRRAMRNVEHTKSRLNNIKRYLFDNFVMSDDDTQGFNEWQKALFFRQNLGNPFLLRKNALDSAISINELCQIVIHIVKHRAYNDSGKEYEVEEFLESRDKEAQNNSKNVKKGKNKDKDDKKEENEKLKSAMKANLKIVGENRAILNAKIYDRQFEEAKKYAENEYEKLIQKGYKAQLSKDEWIEKVAQNSVKMRNGKVLRLNKNGNEVEEQSFTNSMPRSAIKAELTAILERQKDFHKDLAQEIEALKNKIFEENDDGLGYLQNRPLKSSKKFLGKCVIDRREWRASAFAPSTITFNLHAKLADLLTYLKKQYSELEFDYEKTHSATFEALKIKKKLTFSDIRECIYLKNTRTQIPRTLFDIVDSGDSKSIKDDYEINLLRFNTKGTDDKDSKKSKRQKQKTDSEKRQEQEKKNVFYDPSKKLALLEHTFGDFWSKQRDVDILAGIISVNKCTKDIQKGLDELNGEVDKDLQKKALESRGARFGGTSSYCLKVIWECLDSMQEGVSEYEATQTYKANHADEIRAWELANSIKEPSLHLPEFESTQNANLDRICAQVRAVVNAIFAKHGAVGKIRIELLRDVGRSEEQKTPLTQAQKENEGLNECAKSICKELWGETGVSKERILKVRLWILQNEIDIYPTAVKGEGSVNEVRKKAGDSVDVYDDTRKIKLQDLIEENKLQIDHIIPRSRSLDDSFGNKVLTFTNNNATKRDRTPYEWFGNNKVVWQAFNKRVESTHLSNKAKNHLTTQEKPELNATKFLNDTKTAAVYIRNYLEKYVKFADVPSKLQDDEEVEKKQIRHIEVVNGRLTSAMRHFWGVGKKDRANHLHHAQDAAIIAFCGSKTIQNFAKLLQANETGSTDGLKLSSEQISEIIGQHKNGRFIFRRPFSGFTNDLRKRIYGDESSEGIFVSQYRKHKDTGKLHNEKPLNIKDNLNKGDKEELQKRRDKAHNNEVLPRIEEEKARLGRELTKIEYGKIKSRILHPIEMQFYEEVKKRQIKDNVWMEPETRRGQIYAIDEKARIDIFAKDKKGKDRFYAVPVFMKDKELSNIARPYKSDDDKMDDKDFLFSLYPWDLVEFVYDDGVVRYGYYRAFKQDGRIKVKHHSGFLSKTEMGEFWKDAEKGYGKEKWLSIKSIKSLKLAHIDALGDRKTLKALDIQKGERKRGKAPLQSNKGRR